MPVATTRRELIERRFEGGRGSERERERGMEAAPPPPPKTRREFPAFPYDPYPIQSDFMAALYGSLDKGGVAMLESPTGGSAVPSSSFTVLPLPLCDS